MAPGGIHTRFRSWGGCMGPGLKIVLYFLKEPRRTNTGPSDHGPVQTIFVPHFHGHYGTVHITVPENGNMHPLVVLYLGDRGPIGLALVHLYPRSAMDGDGLTSHILQSLRNLDYFNGIMVPSQPCLYGNRKFGMFYHGLGQGYH